MVQEGWAWHYVQYSKDALLAKAEKEAREAKRGLWAGPNPIPPWEYRKGKVDPKEADPNAEVAKLTVYVTKSGQKYHREGCRSLAKSSILMPLGQAAGKYGPCSICNPPTLKAAQKEPDTVK